MTGQDGRQRTTRPWFGSPSLWLVSPALLVTCVVVIVPLLALSFLSFWVDGRVSIGNYLGIVGDPGAVNVFLSTFEVSVMVTVLCVAVGYPFTYVITRLSPRLEQIALFVVLIPFWTSVLVRTYAWLVILGRNGVVNSVLLSLHVLSQPLSLVYNLTGTVIGMVHVMLPFFIFPLRASMKTIPDEAMVAASSLGAGPTIAFWRVFFPLSLRGLSNGALVVFIVSLGFYITPVILGGGKVPMIAVLIENSASVRYDWGEASTLGVILIVATGCLLYGATVAGKVNRRLRA